MTKFPILLAHGIAPFDQLTEELFAIDNSATDDLHYFKGIRTMLMKAGYSVYHSRVEWAAPVDDRAADLKENVLRVLKLSGQEKLHIVAHSMGGLDARHMLFNYQAEKIHQKIVSLSTISTPHLGTSFADWGIANGNEFIDFCLKTFQADLRGFRDLTRGSCKSFNEKAKNFEATCGVKFYTFAGRQFFQEIMTALKFSYAIIFANEKDDNDGLVSVNSAAWEKKYFKQIWNADHLNELAWIDIANLIWSTETESQFTERIHKHYRDLAAIL